MSASHWFWTHDCSDGFRIITQGKGNHPMGKYWYETREEMEDAKSCFIEDGYEFMGHRS
jgi:hypothetical protein